MFPKERRTSVFLYLSVNPDAVHGAERTVTSCKPPSSVWYQHVSLLFTGTFSAACLWSRPVWSSASCSPLIVRVLTSPQAPHLTHLHPSYIKWEQKILSACPISNFHTSVPFYTPVNVEHMLKKALKNGIYYHMLHWWLLQCMWMGPNFWRF